MIRRSPNPSRLVSSLRTLTLAPTPTCPAAPPPQHHQLQQRAPVSGTAKGKGKLKSGQPLKRSSIPKKKPSGGGGGGGGGGGDDSSAASRGGRSHRDAVERLNQMVSSCLSAPTPLRHLSPKDRRREAEREKLGLISKERQRELDLAKARSKKKSPAAASEEEEEEEERVLMGTPGLDPITLGLVDAHAIPSYELTAEDGRRLAREYSRVLMRRHRARQAAESNLLRLKKAAVAALPDHLRAAALVPDLTPFPANRFMATLTPPIDGYIEQVREAAKKYSVKEKLR